MKMKNILAVLLCACLLGGCFSNAGADAPFSLADIENNTIYSIDDFCRLFEADKDFSLNNNGKIFAVLGIIKNNSDIDTESVNLTSSFISKNWGKYYKLSCKFADKSIIEELKAGDAVIISGNLFSASTSGIILQNCVLISADHAISDSIDKNLPNDVPKTDGSSSVMIESSSSLPSSFESSSSVVGSSKASASSNSSSQSNKSSPAQTQSSNVQSSSMLSSSTNKQDVTQYVLNTSTKKFHLPTCSSVKKIKPENYATIDSRDSAIAQGYSPCKNCNP